MNTDMGASQHPLILVVDDETSLRFLLHNRLLKLGFKGEYANNGREALDKIRDGCHPQIILTDLTMPDMGGLELLKELRAQGHKIPTFVMTGFPEPELDLIFRELGVIEVFVKPFSYKQMLARISQLLRESEISLSEKSG